MQSTFLIIPVAAALALFPIACGSDNSPEHDPDTIETACDEYATARCDTMQRCTEALFYFVYGNPELCRQQLSEWCKHTGTLPGVIVTPKAIVSCASTFATMSCNTWLERRDRHDSHDDDRDPLCDAPVGTLDVGEICFEGYQCASRTCYLDTEGVCGKCQSPRKVNDSCRRSLDCPPNTSCSAGTCIETAGLGQSCLDTPCKGYLRCKYETCVMPPALGELCAEEKFCDNRIFTECREGTCESTALAYPGEACGRASGQIPNCAGGICSSQNKCENPVPAERSCDTHDRCQQPLRCVKGWCKPLTQAMCE